MDLELRHRLRTALAAAIAGFAVLCLAWLTSAPDARAAVGDPLLPNLVTLNISQDDLEMEQPHKKPLLGLSNEVANLGQGPLEIFASAHSHDCDGDSKPGNDRNAYQRIYSDDGDGVFNRDLDTGSSETKFGCERLGDDFYWQVWNLARYRLLRERDGAAVATRQKVAYCTVDSIYHPHFELPGQSSTGYYPVDGCAPDGTLGISIGWADLYSFYIPTQLINVAGVKPGDYCLRSAADPRNLLQETDDSDNVREVRLHLNPRTLTVKRLGGACELGG
jgi:Lysyl oxidase